MTKPAEINRELKAVLHPELLAAGFTTINGRKAWRHDGKTIVLCEVAAVGVWFSQATGYPAASLRLSLNLFYEDFPDGKKAKDKSVDGVTLPKDTECHFRFSLDAGLDQSAQKKTLQSAPERNRKDIWWIEPSGSNLKEVVADLRDAFRTGLVLISKECYTREEQVRRYEERGKPKGAHGQGGQAAVC